MIRLNKSISIAVLTAVTSTIIPAASVSAAVNLEAVDGTINKATAFANGTYIFEGYRNEDQESSVYFFNGQNDQKIEDVDTIGEKYGLNYINFNNDDVLFNLATGQAEDDIEDDIISKLKVKVKSVLKKAKRYKDTQDILSVQQISKDTFGTIWYEFVVGDKNNKDKTYTIYMNNTGKYIDSTYTLNLVYYDQEGNKFNFDKYEDLEDNKNLSIVQEKTLLTDSDSLYKVIGILDKEKLASGKSVRDSITTYALKISMEQGSKEDGTYIPKSVVSYETYDLDALEVMDLYDEGKVTARVNGNSLYVIKPDFEDEKITVDRYKLRKIKDDKTVEGKTLDKRVLELDEDFDDIQDEDMIDYSNDLYGNLWVLQKGKIKKMVNGNLETMYTVDRSINKLSVFAENSLIAWSTDTDIYSVVGGEAAQEKKEEKNAIPVKENVESSKEIVEKGEAQKPAVQNGWIKNADGTWSYSNEGTIAKGWMQDNGAWYYLNSLGIMHTGWFKDLNGKWYYLKESGEMEHDTSIDGYQLGTDGAMY